MIRLAGGAVGEEDIPSPQIGGQMQVNARHLLGRPAHEGPVVAVEFRIGGAEQPFLVVAQEHDCAQLRQPVMHGAALRAEVHMVAQGDDLVAFLRRRMGQHGLQRGEVAVDVGQNEGGHGQAPFAGRFVPL